MYRQKRGKKIKSYHNFKINNRIYVVFTNNKRIAETTIHSLQNIVSIKFSKFATRL